MACGDGKIPFISAVDIAAVAFRALQILNHTIVITAFWDQSFSLMIR
jgi:hypothetical protein